MTARLIMKMRVSGTRDEPGGIRVLTLKHPMRDNLAEPSPGAHVDLRLPDGKIRQYSLCGDPSDLSRYQIAVKRENEGRGGSKWIHENLVCGVEAHISTPRNNFPLREGAKKHILIAGGIGITPFLAMVRRLAKIGENFELHYCSRIANPAFFGELARICGKRLRLYGGSGDGSVRFDAAKALKTFEDGSHVYACGPKRLTDAVREAAAHWPEGHVHFEVFQATLDENFQPEPFDIKIASTGQVLRVPQNESALNRLRAAGFVLPSSCELGVCGACECGYRDGIVIHRDAVLPVAARQDRMMLCVSRARAQVTLDL
jgi:ferredoxin-NADP reductase